MPNLKIWIEAQLKRGYSINSIKSVLVKRGYPPEAVAEVDRIGDSAVPSKKIIKKSPSKPIILAGIAVTVVFLAWVFNALPPFSKQASGDVVLPEQKSAAQIKEEERAAREEVLPLNLQSELDFIEKLCEKYPIVENEVSCRNAIVLGKYPSKVYSINREKVDVFANGKSSAENVWVLAINLGEPTEIGLPNENKEIRDKFEVFVNVNTGIATIKAEEDEWERTAQG